MTDAPEITSASARAAGAARRPDLVGKPIGRRVRFHHIFKPRGRPPVRVFRTEVVRAAT